MNTCANAELHAEMHLSPTNSKPEAVTLWAQVGAELGVGMCEMKALQGTNWRLFAKTATSWVFTLIVTALLSAAFFAQGLCVGWRVG